MSSVLICAPDPLGDELHETILWRGGIERHVASRFEDALTIAVAVHPRLVVVDRDLPRAERLVGDLRNDPTTRDCSIVIVARGEFETGELRFLDAGANVVLRLPAGPEWDERLGQLMNVPARREARIPVRLHFEARLSHRVETAEGHVVNLSASGMRVETSAALELWMDIDFAFPVPDSGARVVGCGQVVRQATPGEFGVRFYGLEGEGPDQVRRFVEG